MFRVLEFECERGHRTEDRVPERTTEWPCAVCAIFGRSGTGRRVHPAPEHAQQFPERQ